MEFEIKPIGYGREKVTFSNGDIVTYRVFSRMHNRFDCCPVEEEVRFRKDLSKWVLEAKREIARHYVRKEEKF